MNENPEIKLTDTPMSAVMKLSKGNPGAVTAMMALITEGDGIDPDAFMGGFGCLLSLDNHKIYGTDIYVLWSDICMRNTARMIAVLRAVQLGFLKESVLQEACSAQDYSGCEKIDVLELYEKVCEQLPRFDSASVAVDENKEYP